MFSREQFLESVAHEGRVIRHLATKVPAGSYEWKPTPAQRSTIDLMRYLTTCAIVPALALIRGNWDHAEEMERAAERVTPETFAAAMDEQDRALRAAVSAVPEGEFSTRSATMPWGSPCRLGEGLVNTVLKAMTAYRMQFFLYAKQSGNRDLGPANCWVGVDRPRA